MHSESVLEVKPGKVEPLPENAKNGCLIWRNGSIGIRMKTSASSTFSLADPHRPKQIEDQHMAARNPDSSRSQRAVAWIIVVVLLALSLAAAYLLWAKANGGWPLINF
jgi:hypothetical protein